jgi:hypothetical protein
LKASKECRNKLVNPENRAIIGQKCDYILTYKGHSVCPELAIGEISGGLPEGAHWKMWHDYLIKLVLGARDCLERIYQAAKVAEGDIVIYCFQVQGKRYYQ